MEKRRHVRQKVEAALAVWGIASGTRRASRGHCLNLSESGAGAIVSGKWLPGQVVSMELILPADMRPMMLQARVCHRQNLYCGFEFLGTGEALISQLRQACAST
ncbi:MAG: PilZ domain-containing protein [Terriglobales bacterium]